MGLTSLYLFIFISIALWQLCICQGFVNGTIANSTTHIALESLNVTVNLSNFSPAPALNSTTLEITDSPIIIVNQLAQLNTSSAGQLSDLLRNFYTGRHIGHSSAHTCGVRDANSPALRPYRILMSVSDKYMSVVLNWLIFFHRLCPDRSSMFFICLDKPTETMMHSYGLQCSHVYHTTGSNNKLWLMRVRVSKQLLDQGFDVLMSDADAVWLRNPFETIEKYPNSDILGSRASFPDDVVSVYGATFCMGFIYIKATSATKKMWNELSTTMGTLHRPDDQRSFNQLLLKLGLKYAHRLGYADSIEADVGHLNYDGKHMEVTLLAHRDFRRVCDGVKRPELHAAAVVHCLSEKNGKAKEVGSKSYGIWLVRDNWTKIAVPASNNTDEFLMAVVVSSKDKDKDKHRLLAAHCQGRTDAHDPAPAHFLAPGPAGIHKHNLRSLGSPPLVLCPEDKDIPIYAPGLARLWNISVHSSLTALSRFETTIHDSPTMTY